MLALLTLAAGPAKGADTPLGSPRTNQGCSCGPSAAPEENDGIVWVGTTNPGFREIVGILAPIFWYTADEPAIILGDTPIPHPYPCDPEKANAKEGIVYYQVNWLIRREAREAPLSEPVEEDPRFFEKVSVFALRYYIYHRFDYGLNGHEHDLEMAVRQFAGDEKAWRHEGLALAMLRDVTGGTEAALEKLSEAITRAYFSHVPAAQAVGSATA